MMSSCETQKPGSSGSLRAGRCSSEEGRLAQIFDVSQAKRVIERRHRFEVLATSFDSNVNFQTQTD